MMPHTIHSPLPSQTGNVNFPLSAYNPYPTIPRTHFQPFQLHLAEAVLLQRPSMYEQRLTELAAEPAPRARPNTIRASFRAPRDIDREDQRPSAAGTTQTPITRG